MSEDCRRYSKVFKHGSNDEFVEFGRALPAKCRFEPWVSAFGASRHHAFRASTGGEQPSRRDSAALWWSNAEVMKPPGRVQIGMPCDSSSSLADRLVSPLFESSGGVSELFCNAAMLTHGCGVVGRAGAAPIMMLRSLGWEGSRLRR